MEGIAVLRPRESVFTTPIRALLPLKLREYDEVGPAIEELCARLKPARRRQ